MESETNSLLQDAIRLEVENKTFEASASYMQEKQSKEFLLEEALKFYKHISVLYKKLGDLKQSIRIYVDRYLLLKASELKSVSNYEEAAHLYNEAAEYYMYAYTKFEDDQYFEYALDYYMKASDLYRKLSKKQRFATMNSEHAEEISDGLDNMIRLGQYEQAAKLASKLASYYDCFGAISYKSNMLYKNAGNLYERLGDSERNSEEAIRYYLQAKEMYKKIEESSAQNLSLHRISKAYKDLLVTHTNNGNNERSFQTEETKNHFKTSTEAINLIARLRDKVSNL